VVALVPRPAPAAVVPSSWSGAVSSIEPPQAKCDLVLSSFAGILTVALSCKSACFFEADSKHADSNENRFVCLKAVARMLNYSSEWPARCEHGIVLLVWGPKPIRGA
jgi:hypothetical protein